ncbi:hypothetical protein BDP27DRAFT_1415490 [Rhodocollybia butyracea]|uniref:Uncharacterized protein n=1 Tax=Rhodocollybia butyracea TaxID=206335 RepID=A0A9P5Q5T9_9AGAR|nr:hypothetical protein BDP27DRAFT_1415490 [Rhodocollybia butyracea]
MNSTGITCVKFQWSSNSLGQNPCEIAERLNSACTTSNGSYFPELDAQVPFTLSSEDQNPCVCTSVVYNLVSLCRLCQTVDGLTYATWTQWTTNCSTLQTGFPMGIPSGTAVPAWAYQNVTQTNAFNETLAAEVATNNHTESSSAPVPSSTNAPLPASDLSKPKNKTAAIVGGVIAGLIGVALLALIVFWLQRRKRARSAPSTAYLETRQGPSAADTSFRGQYAPIGVSKHESKSGPPHLPYHLDLRSPDDSDFSFDPYDPSLTGSLSKESKEETISSPP